MTPVEKAVLETLAYFEQWQRALSPEEIHYYLWQREAFPTATETALDSLMSKSLIVSDGERFALSDLSLTKTDSRQRLLASRRKLALVMAKKISEIPGITSILLMNSTAMQTCKNASDIDLLIITHPGRLFSARALVLMQLKSSGLAKNKYRQAGKACLGYWLSNDQLSVEKYQTDLRSGAYWLSSMVPLYGYDGYHQFIEANNWVFDYLPNWQAHQIAHLAENRPHPNPLLRGEGKQREDNFLLPPLRGEGWGEVALRSIEYIVYRLSWVKIMFNPQFRNSTELVCTPSTLKLHSIDRRIDYSKTAESIFDKIVFPNHVKST